MLEFIYCSEYPGTKILVSAEESLCVDGCTVTNIGCITGAGAGVGTIGGSCDIIDAGGGRQDVSTSRVVCNRNFRSMSFLQDLVRV